VPHTRRYIVTERILRVWWTRFGGPFSCLLCDVVLTLGDDVVSKGSSYRVNTGWRHYHKRCLEEGSVPRARTLQEAGP